MEGQIYKYNKLCADKSNDVKDNISSSVLAKITLHSITQEHKSYLFYSYTEIKERNAP